MERRPTHDAEAGAMLARLFDEHARMVFGLCRALLVDPEWPEKARTGRGDEEE